MSASPLPFLVPRPPAPHRGGRTSPRQGLAVAMTVRRRPSMQQGMALERLGHAIEYLVDSRMFLVNEPQSVAETDAIKILSRASREVFASCAVVVPLQHRIKMWAAGRLGVAVIDPWRHA